MHLKIRKCIKYDTYFRFCRHFDFVKMYYAQTLTPRFVYLFRALKLWIVIMKEKIVLKAEHISVRFRMYDKGLNQRELTVIHDLSIRIHEGEILAVVGASGSGKSVLAHAILGILPSNASVGGEIRYCGEALTAARMKKLVGSEIIMIPQSVTYLDPLMRAGEQVRGIHGTQEQQKAAF